MKLLKSATAVSIFLFASLFSSSALASDKSEYIVEFFNMLTAEATTKALNDFSSKHNAEVVSCDTSDTKLVCVFKKSS